MRGLILLSVKPIRDGEEIFMDYRLNPKLNNAPDWYTHVDLEESARRWEPQSEAKSDDPRPSPGESNHKNNHQEVGQA